jgi:hypothetical protein
MYQDILSDNIPENYYKIKLIKGNLIYYYKDNIRYSKKFIYPYTINNKNVIINDVISKKEIIWFNENNYLIKWPLLFKNKPLYKKSISNIPDFLPKSAFPNIFNDFSIKGTFRDFFYNNFDNELFIKYISEDINLIKEINKWNIKYKIKLNISEELYKKIIDINILLKYFYNEPRVC